MTVTLTTVILTRPTVLGPDKYIFKKRGEAQSWRLPSGRFLSGPVISFLSFTFLKAAKECLRSINLAVGGYRQKSEGEHMRALTPLPDTSKCQRSEKSQPPPRTQNLPPGKPDPAVGGLVCLSLHTALGNVF